jgi:hypothetical protein
MTTMSKALKHVTPSSITRSREPARERKPASAGAFKERVAALAAPVLSTFAILRPVKGILMKPVMLAMVAGGKSPLPVPLWLGRGMPVLMLLVVSAPVYRLLIRRYPGFVLLWRILLGLFTALLLAWFILMSTTQDESWIRRGMLVMALGTASFTVYRLLIRKHPRWMLVLRGLSVLFTAGVITWSLMTFGF